MISNIDPSSGNAANLIWVGRVYNSFATIYNSGATSTGTRIDFFHVGCENRDGLVEKNTDVSTFSGNTIAGDRVRD